MINKITSFKDLEIWQEAHSLVLEVYGITRDFPREEIYGLISQIRRSAVSVAACIVEGHSRNTTKEFIKFLFDARGSCAETKYHLLLSKDLGYINSDVFEKLNNRYEILGKPRTYDLTVGALGNFALRFFLTLALTSGALWCGVNALTR